MATVGVKGLKGYIHMA